MRSTRFDAHTILLGAYCWSADLDVDEDAMPWIACNASGQHALFRPEKEKRHARLPRGVCMFGEPRCL